MKIFQYGINTLHIANSNLREEKRRLRDVSLDRLISLLVYDSYARLGTGIEIETGNYYKFLDFCRSISKKDSDFKVGILDAHGKNYFGRWYYSDGIFPKSVQKWIDEYDGIYDLLLLHVCNTEHVKPIIKKSMAVVPTDDVCHMLNIAGTEHLLVIPGKGAVSFNKNTISKLPSYNLLEYLQSYVPSA